MFFFVKNNAVQYRSKVKCCHLIWATVYNSTVQFTLHYSPVSV